MLVLAPTGREDAVRSARLVAGRLMAEGIEVRVIDEDAPDLHCTGATLVSAGPDAAKDAELIFVLGGDGSLLRAAEYARGPGTPVIGVNLGHVGFLAEAEADGLAETVDRVVAGEYRVEERMTVDVIARSRDGAELARTWALNEATVEKTARERMIEVVIGVDGRPLSRWGCDGVVCATPTGSTAYSFSAGGPVVWPEVEAMLMVPISAHALFAPPLVVSPESVLAVELVYEHMGSSEESGRLAETAGAVMWCDGRRRFDLPPRARVEVRRGRLPVRLARVQGLAPETGGGGPFTDRLVAKFGLPVAGWRGREGKETVRGHA
ncbi:MAG: NAD kinase [Streptosporangiales bacterium]|nr:NAD kinase [Streptosporangiales bacterium]